MTASQPYHHGELRNALIGAATQIIEQDGIDALSIRKLAVQVGVSRTAPYHHFKDKNALLSAIAEEGFKTWQTSAKNIFEQQELALTERFRLFIHDYVGYASAHPELYDLMFGRILWGKNNATEPLKAVAYPCFQYQLEMTRTWQKHGLLPSGPDALRLAQVTWSTLHGIARLLIDGIFADASHIGEMCDCAAEVLMQRTPEQS
ncbi:TetR/AcrR family transcriptional regulator [Alteromonas sp. C1M14]|uniref:TetR/AcrR family transcriptional regulator n=1 Tax=Alteromonas sp. C1M14 TaxID=2841567 RepID=UPI001C087246|nr:TetR/AcrR family transcriptional regulator [Alteromonas sp. C1M14]MBU2979757.1 TetR/AcrR family transcriptional regulator [Alteromonas sp. C1M14]